MKKGFIRPKWWLLYLSVAFVLGLFWLEVKAPFSKLGHTWTEIGLVFILYGVVTVWLRASEAVLLHEEREKFRKNTIQETFELSQPKSSNHASRNENGRLPGRENPLAGRILPASLISLAAIISKIFSIQDR